MELYTILSKECCTVQLEARHKDGVLLEISRLAKRSPLLDAFTEQELFAAFKDREAQGSTGFGEGVALPHIRIKGINEFLVFIAVSPQGAEFSAMDRKKVKLFFVVVAPEKKVNEHVQILAAIARAIAVGNFKKELLASRSEGVLYETFLRHVQHTVEGGAAKRKMKLMFVILYFDEYLYHILEYFIQEGIDGATIMESSGMGTYISSIPLFASFIGFMNEKRNHSKTIMALIPEDRENEIVQGIEEITGDLDRKDGAMVVLLDVSFFKGSMRMM